MPEPQALRRSTLTKLTKLAEADDMMPSAADTGSSIDDRSPER